jgi:hypothetical protein
VPSSSQLDVSIPASTAGPLHPATVALLGAPILLEPGSGDLGLAGVLMIHVAPHNSQARLHRPKSTLLRQRPLLSWHGLHETESLIARPDW